MKIKTLSKLFLSIFLLFFVFNSILFAEIIMPPLEKGIRNTKIQRALGRLIKKHSTGNSKEVKSFSKKRLLPVKDDMVKVVIVLESGKTVDYDILEDMEIGRAHV